MTWNIHGGIGTDGKFALDRIVEVISRHDPDVVALQEVDSRRRKPGERSPFDLLREVVGEHGAEAKSIVTADGDYGQMLMSRWPLVSTEIHDLTHKEREPRRAIETKICAAGGNFRVVAAHFGLSLVERRTQARRLVEIARRHPMMTVMLGDFNDWSGRAPCAMLSSGNCPRAHARHISLGLPDIPSRSYFLLALAHENAQLRRSSSAPCLGSLTHRRRHCIVKR